MRNPAWRPARLQTERLAGIQHYFIDERPGAGPADLHTLPVHLAVTPGHPADALQPRTLVDALTRELNQHASEDPGWRLQAIPPEHAAAHAARGLQLVFATANLEGVRLAYTLIRKLSVSPAAHFGVLFSGAEDAELAQRCQQRLATGALRFLGISLHDLGYLAGPGPDFSMHMARLAEALERLRESRPIQHPTEAHHP